MKKQSIDAVSQNNGTLPGVFKKAAAFVTSFGFLISLGLGSAAIAAVTISGTGIIGDTVFNTISSATSTVIDVGSGKTLSLQTGNNGPITTGSGLFTFGGNFTAGKATTTSFAITGIASGNCLHTTAGGAVVGTGSDCGAGGGGTPGGSNGQVQVNSGGTSFVGQASSLNGGSSSVFQRAEECATGTVSLSGGTWTYPGGTVSATGSATQEIPIITGLNGNSRYTRVMVAESTIFASASVTNTKISIGRAGSSTNDEMLPQTSFMVSSGNAWFAEDRPQTPILGASNTYNLVLAVRTTGGNVSALTGGAVYYEVCGYKIP